MTRPWNVLAIGAMVAITLHWLGFPLEELWHGGAFGWIAVPMLIGAAGNLINDFFDLKEDRINKPHRVKVGRTVKRRVVIVTHWGLTLAALIWSAWLSRSNGNILPLALAASFSLALYLYSPWLKGRGALGNVTVATCVAGLCLWAMSSTLDLGDYSNTTDIQCINFVFMVFLLTFLREWVKDILDMEGDVAAQHRTLASRWSFARSKVLLWTGLGLFAGLSVWWTWERTLDNWQIMALAIGGAGSASALLCKNTKALSAWLKVALGTLFLSLL